MQLYYDKHIVLSLSVDCLQGILVLWETSHPDVSRKPDVLIFQGVKYLRELGCTETSGVGICTDAASYREITEPYATLTKKVQRWSAMY